MKARTPCIVLFRDQPCGPDRRFARCRRSFGLVPTGGVHPAHLFPNRKAARRGIARTIAQRKALRGTMLYGYAPEVAATDFTILNVVVPGGAK